jgi:hypothetical protein
VAQKALQVSGVADREGILRGSLASSVPRDISSVIISGGSSGWDSFVARSCAFSSRGNASSRPTIPPRAGPSGELSPQLTAFFTSAPILASSAAVNSFSAKAVGHMARSSRFALSLKPSVAYLVLNFCAGWKKKTTLPSLV